MEVPTLTQVYSDPAIVESARWWTDFYRSSPEGLLNDVGPLGQVATTNALTDGLDTLETCTPAHEAAATLLGSLPTKLLVEHYGIETAAWVVGNDHVEERGARVAEGLVKHGFDPLLLQKARRLARRDTAPSGRDVLAHHAVMKELIGGGLKHLDVPAALQASVRPEIDSPLSDKRMGDYDLIPMQIEPDKRSIRGKVFEWEGREQQEKPGLEYKIYLDTPVGYALTYKGQPQVVVGVKANGPDELLIRQMQGIKGYKYDIDTGEYTGRKPARGLFPLDWQNTTVHLTAQLAQRMDMNSVGIVAGHTIPNYYFLHLTTEQAQQAYDVPAQRLGFNGDPENGWHKNVADILA